MSSFTASSVEQLQKLQMLAREPASETEKSAGSLLRLGLRHGRYAAPSGSTSGEGRPEVRGC